MNTTSRLALSLRRVLRHFQPQRFKEYYVQQALDSLGGGVYLEIGVRCGDSFRYLKAKEKIGVDPCRTSQMSVLRLGESFHEMSSDAFFNGPARSIFTNKMVDVCLVDGLHSFSQSLKDVLNAVQILRSDGVVLLDDVNPDTADKASPTPHGRAWNGDVWKTMAILRATQPQWRVYSLPVDEGVGFVMPCGCSARSINAETFAHYERMDFQVLQANPGLIGLI